MSVLDAGSLPYPEMDIAQALANLAPEDTAMVPVFTPAPVAVDVPSSAAVVPPPEPTFTPRRLTPPRLPRRQPRAGLTGPVPFARPERDLVVLAKVSDALRNRPRDGEVLFAEAVADVYGTGPAVVVQPQAAPVPAPTPADERARYALAEIVYAAALHAEPPYGPYCPGCKAADSGWCAECLEAGAKSEALYRLHGLILAADTYAAAVVLVARSVLSPAVVYAEGAAR